MPSRLFTRFPILLMGMALALTTVCASVGAPTIAGASTPTSNTYTRAAFYFGNASPLNFWSSDLSGAKAAFEQTKADGFNAVELAVPWGEFQTGVNPAQYNQTAFNALSSLVAQAASIHLPVILRLSYAVDIDPSDQDPNRGMEIYANSTVYNSWLGYISHVHQAVAKYHDVKIAQLSWEDFWTPVANAINATTASQRLQLAVTTGFRPWLKRTHSLASVSKQYGTTFTSWSQVPTPPYTQPSFALMYQYYDWAMVHRFFVPAAARFPGLNLEARIDMDAINSGGQEISTYSHASTFDLPGTSYIGMYFAPSVGDPSTAHVETASEGLQALRTTLTSMHTRSGGRPLFIFEDEFYSNSPEVITDPAVPPSQLPALILGSAPILSQYTLGYSLWTYHDYNQSPVYNPSFTLGTSGWQVSGSAKPAKSPTATSLSLQKGASVAQAIPAGNLVSSPASDVTVSVAAAALSGSPATLTVSLGGAPARSITVGADPQTYSLQFPLSEVTASSASPELSVSTSAPVSLSDVQVYDFTQLGYIYNADGAPEVGAVPLRTMNQDLAASGSSVANG